MQRNPGVLTVRLGHTHGPFQPQQWGVPTGQASDAPPTPRAVVRREVLRFAVPAVIGLAVLIAVSLAVSVAVARDQSTRSATLTAEFLARSVVEPRLDEALVRGRPQALSELDGALAVTPEGSDILGVRVWNSAGVIVYADDPRVIGEKFDLGEISSAALQPGADPVAGPADVSRPENRYLDPDSEIVDVTMPITGKDGRTYLFQMHQLQDTLREDARAVWISFAPVLVGSLLLVALLLGMLAVRMARRISADLAVRQELLQRSMDAADVERRRIAAQLHDGTVQDLAGLSYSLAGLSARARGLGDPEQSDQLDAAAAQSRDAVRGLRSLLVDIYPANLDRTGLAPALTDLAAPLEARAAVSVDVDEVPGLDAAVQSAVYRVAREALANIGKHAAAEHVWVQFGRSAAGSVTLTVRDDGRGFDPEQVPSGHLGLAISRDLADSVGATYRVHSQLGDGTTVSLEVSGG